MQFVCKRKCQYKRSIYDVGEKIDVDTIVKCPECKGTGEVNGKPCFKCKGTKRSDPPHHFEPVDNKEKPVTVVDSLKPAEDANKTDEAEAIETLRKQFEEKGIAFDLRWGLKKLEAEFKKAEKEGKTK